jgi:hypothetical protein
MKYFMYAFENNCIKLIVEGEDVSGYYLYIFQDPSSEQSTADYHYETLEEAFFASEKKFGVSRSQWIEKQSNI